MSEPSANSPKSPLVWSLYGFAFLSLFVAPFGPSEFDGAFGSGISGPIAKILLFIVLAMAGAAVHKERFDSMTAIRWCVAGYVVVEAMLFEPPLAMPVRLLPLAVLALGQSAQPSSTGDGGLLGAIPAPFREALAFGLAVIGTSLAIAGFDLTNGANFEEFSLVLILPGVALFAISVTVMLSALTSGYISKVLLGSYAATLFVFVVGQIVRLAVGRLSPADRWTVGVEALLIVMLLVQIWRQWDQRHALLKMVEAFVGACIVAASLQKAGAASEAMDPFYLLIAGPMFLLSLAGIVLGLFLIWSSRPWLLRIVPGRWSRS